MKQTVTIRVGYLIATLALLLLGNLAVLALQIISNDQVSDIGESQTRIESRIVAPICTSPEAVRECEASLRGATTTVLTKLCGTLDEVLSERRGVEADCRVTNLPSNPGPRDGAESARSQRQESAPGASSGDSASPAPEPSGGSDGLGGGGQGPGVDPGNPGGGDPGGGDPGGGDSTPGRPDVCVGGICVDIDEDDPLGDLLP